jgi:methionyl-tRNA synthetase
MISIDDFSKVEMRIGKILSVDRVPDTDKLLRLSVDFGLQPSVNASGSPDLPAEQEGRGEERDIRQVVSGIAEYFEDPQQLVNKRCPFVTNLEPRTIRGLQSQAMIVAVHTPEGAFSILEPTGAEVPPGTKLN